MNKLYILGALALSNVEAYINFGTPTANYIAPNYGSYGAITYSVSTDCFSTGTATSLGMNNIYHQYYTFKLTKSTASYATIIHISPVTPGTPVSTPMSALTAEYKGCYHNHLYNWMAQPQVTATTAATVGFGNALSAYGYAMTGSTAAACAAATAVTTTLYKSNVFYGGQYNNAAGIINYGNTGTAVSTIVVPLYGRVGPMYYYTKTGTLLTFTAAPAIAPAIASGQIVVHSAQNAYWDFLQNNVIQGMTQLGRGGGSTSAPCGWWVVYAYEATFAGSHTDVDAVNINPDYAELSIHMWTDNSVIKAASAFVLTALAGLLF